MPQPLKGPQPSFSNAVHYASALIMLLLTAPLGGAVKVHVDLCPDLNMPGDNAHMFVNAVPELASSL